MPVFYNYLFPVMWVAYTGYWWAMSQDVKKTQRREAGSSRLARLILIVCALVLFWSQSIPVSILYQRFLPPGQWRFWTGAAVTAGGLLFSVWARRQLGRNWSRAVTVKQDHELITTGPYALVRHPIYTGLLLGFLGSAVAVGQWRGLLAVALVFLALLSKLRLEEQWMRAHFGEPYETYSSRVSALVPYLF